MTLSSELKYLIDKADDVVLKLTVSYVVLSLSQIGRGSSINPDSIASVQSQYTDGYISIMREISDYIEAQGPCKSLQRPIKELKKIKRNLDSLLN